MASSHGADRISARRDLGDNPRLVLIAPCPPPPGAGKHLQPADWLRDSTMFSVHSKPSGQNQTADSQISTSSGRWSQNTAYGRYSVRSMNSWPWREALSKRNALEGLLIGRSEQIKRVRSLVSEVANSPVDVLIHGETGTGKELVAQALHNMSSRKTKPFVALNCGGMPDTLLDSELFGHEVGAFTGAQRPRIGKIEYANGGTLFLDEVETMPMGMQVKLLRERKIE